MNPDLLALLRCPLDPTRTTKVAAEREVAVCQQCDVHFPVKLGLANLIPTEAVLPPGVTEVSQLPCQRRANRVQSRSG